MIQSLKVWAKEIGAHYHGPDCAITGVGIDSRAVKTGELFVAIRGENLDGHQFVSDALQRGAAAVMVDHLLEIEIPQIVVSNTTKALGDLAHNWRQRFHIPVLALTGSCGKTTTKEMMSAILSQMGPTLSTQGNLNNQFGVPLTLLKLRPQHHYAVIEMGTNSPGEIAYISKMAEPTLALVTNIQSSHIGGFGSFERLSDEKSDIFKYLSPAGVAVINHDEPFSKTWEAKIDVRHRVRFGFFGDVDVTAEEVVFEITGCRFILKTPLGPMPVQVNLMGDHIPHNVLAAAAATMAVGATLEQVAAGLKSVESVKGRCQPHSLPEGRWLIDDSYNAGGGAVKSALATLAKHQGRKIFIMTNMRELGDHSVELHREMGEWILAAGVDVVLLTGEVEDLKPTLLVCPKAQFFTDRNALINKALEAFTPGTMMWVKGARKYEMDTIVHAIEQHFMKDK